MMLNLLKIIKMKKNPILGGRNLKYEHVQGQGGYVESDILIHHWEEWTGTTVLEDYFSRYQNGNAHTLWLSKFILEIYSTESLKTA